MNDIATDIVSLEKYVHQTMNVLLKDICRPGSYYINLVDVLIFKEAWEGLIDNLEVYFS